MTYYTGNESGQIPGLLPGNGNTCPTCYYWWEAGAMFGALIDYWYFTGDTTYNDVTTQALLFQVGNHNDFEPLNETLSLGNDDQAFWGMAALTAAESKFPNPPPDQPQWLPLAQAVWNRQMPRWDTQYCNGGLRWQFFPTNAGYNYKNTISNGCFFNMGARLGKYTGNQTYLDWAERVWDWSTSSGLISDDYRLFDGMGVDNCSAIAPLQWTYNLGVYMHGVAAMWNAVSLYSALPPPSAPYTNPFKTQATNETAAGIWRERLEGLLGASGVFFQDNIMMEVACEALGTCNVDQKSFKAYLSRWMAETAKIAPWSYDTVMAYLRPSAVAAAAQCSGGSDGTTCGLIWTNNGTNDGDFGVGQQMAALEVVQCQLLDHTDGAVDLSQGISAQDPSAGTYDPSETVLEPLAPITTADLAGSIILTILFGGGTIGGAIWMIM